MRTLTFTILAVLAVVLFAASGAAAHGNDENTTDHDDAPVNGSADDLAMSMEQHMIEHMSADATAHMQERMGMSYQEMSEHMASDQDGSMMGGMGCH